MNFSNTSAAGAANALTKKSHGGLQVGYVVLMLLCFGLAACGTKPKDLKASGPYPMAYPHVEPTPGQPAVQPAPPSDTNPAGPPVVPN